MKSYFRSVHLRIFNIPRVLTSRHLWQVHAVGYPVSMLLGTGQYLSAVPNVPISLGYTWPVSRTAVPFVRPRTNQCPFGATIYVTMGKPEIMDWMASLTIVRIPRRTAISFALVRRLTKPIPARRVSRGPRGYRWHYLQLGVCSPKSGINYLSRSCPVVATLS